MLDWLWQCAILVNILFSKNKMAALVPILTTLQKTLLQFKQTARNKTQKNEIITFLLPNTRKALRKSSCDVIYHYLLH